MSQLIPMVEGRGRVGEGKGREGSYVIPGETLIPVGRGMKGNEGKVTLNYIQETTLTAQYVKRGRGDSLPHTHL